jgi:glycopeptide antibiotics resistance protein
VICAIKTKRVDWKREIQLIFVYICIVVVARFTFFPFSKVNGEIQPLVFESAKAFSFRVNWIPLVNLFDYPEMRDILINVIGNTAMFIPLGIVWPSVYMELDTHWKVISAGIGVSLCIEILQLPFYDRVSDIDDLLLNLFGFVIGYLLYLTAKRLRKKMRSIP